MLTILTVVCVQFFSKGKSCLMSHDKLCSMFVGQFVFCSFVYSTSVYLVACMNMCNVHNSPFV